MDRRFTQHSSERPNTESPLSTHAITRGARHVAKLLGVVLALQTPYGYGSPERPRNTDTEYGDPVTLCDDAAPTDNRLWALCMEHIEQDPSGAQLRALLKQTDSAAGRKDALSTLLSTSNKPTPAPSAKNTPNTTSSPKCEDEVCPLPQSPDVSPDTSTAPSPPSDIDIKKDVQERIAQHEEPLRDGTDTIMLYASSPDGVPHPVYYSQEAFDRFLQTLDISPTLEAAGRSIREILRDDLIDGTLSIGRPLIAKLHDSSVAAYHKQAHRLRQAFDAIGTQTLSEIFHIFATEYRLPPHIALLSLVESWGNITATSSAGAKGLFQIMPDTATQYGYTAEEMTNPLTGARVAAAKLSDDYRRYTGQNWDMRMLGESGWRDGWRLTLGAYNGGWVPRWKSATGGGTYDDYLHWLDADINHRIIPAELRTLGITDVKTPEDAQRLLDALPLTVQNLTYGPKVLALVDMIVTSPEKFPAVTTALQSALVDYYKTLHTL